MTTGAPPGPDTPEPVDRTIFLTRAKLRVHIKTPPDDPWAYDVTHIPADKAERGDETCRNQAELWRILTALKAVEERTTMGWLASFITQPLDRLLVRTERTERLRRTDAPPPINYPGLRNS
jgi:hypothetical protein